MGTQEADNEDIAMGEGSEGCHHLAAYQRTELTHLFDHSFTCFKPMN